jgi:hypothetical protein
MAKKYFHVQPAGKQALRDKLRAVHAMSRALRVVSTGE